MLFLTRLGKIIIWQKIFLEHESPTLKALLLWFHSKQIFFRWDISISSFWFEEVKYMKLFKKIKSKKREDILMKDLSLLKKLYHTWAWSFLIHHPIGVIASAVCSINWWWIGAGSFSCFHSLWTWDRAASPIAPFWKASINYKFQK